MTRAREIIDAFIRAYYAGDVESARDYVCEDLAFTGRAATFTSADDYLSASLHVASMIDSYQIQRIFVDADDVSVFSVLRPKGFAQPIAVADWYHLEHDRIASIQTIFDTGPFASPPTQPAAASTVDPVCHMRVPLTTQSVSRTCANGT